MRKSRFDRFSFQLSAFPRPSSKVIDAFGPFCAFLRPLYVAAGSGHGHGFGPLGFRVDLFELVDCETWKVVVSYSL